MFLEFDGNIGMSLQALRALLPNHGHQEKLFKRDFASEMLDRYRDLPLVDYGVVFTVIVSFHRMH